MDFHLTGKRALVTGSSSGIGEAIARTLAAEGAAVVVHGRREAEAHRVARAIGEAGGRAIVALGDLSDDAAATKVAKVALAGFGGIDILVNNAGVYVEKPWQEAPAADWVDMFNQNVGSMVRMVHHLLPGMKERHWGRVIGIASVVGSLPFPNLAAYSASKAAIINLGVALAKEAAGTGVTANTVSPGPILTPGFEQFVRGVAATLGWTGDWESIERRFVKEMTPNPTERVGRVEEVADLVTFVASPRAGYINGANLRVDGGSVPTVN